MGEYEMCHGVKYFDQNLFKRNVIHHGNGVQRDNICHSGTSGTVWCGVHSGSIQNKQKRSCLGKGILVILPHDYTITKYLNNKINRWCTMSIDSISSENIIHIDLMSLDVYITSPHLFVIIILNVSIFFPFITNNSLCSSPFGVKVFGIKSVTLGIYLTIASSWKNDVWNYRPNS